MKYFFLDWYLMTKRYALRYVRVPTLIVFSIIQPIMFLVLFRYVFGGAILVKTHNYVSYLMPGIIAQTTAFGSIATAVGLAEDFSGGMIERFRSMPVNKSSVLAGRLTTDTLRNILVVMVMVGVGYLVGFRFLNGILPAIAMTLMALFFGLAVSCVSAMIGMKLKDPEAVQSFGLIWLFPLTFVSAAFVPVQTMPGWLQAVAKANPVTIIINSMRSMALGGPLEVNTLEAIAWLGGICIVFLPLAIRQFRKTV